MKRSLLTLVILFLCSLVFAQQSWINISSEEPGLPEINVIEQNTNKVILDISVPGMFVTNVEQDGKIFNRLELIEWQTTKDVGRPELPMINQVIGVPDNKKVRVKILEMEKTVYENYLVYPFQELSKDVQGGFPEGFTIDEKFYSRNEKYPANNVYMNNEMGIWRDVKITGFHFIPFNYNPETGKLEVITHLKVEIEFYDIDTKNKQTHARALSPSRYNMYDAVIANFSSMGYSTTFREDPGVKYLVITNEGALEAIEPFVEWKNQQGFKVEVKLMEEGFNTPQDFKDYITELYENNGLEYILMVGDAYPNGGNNGGPNQVPMFWWAPGGEDASFSDSWYTCMDGPDDHYADIAIGRFTYDGIEDLELQIAKTMGHYHNPDVSSNWAENTLLVAHEQDYPGKYTACKEEIRNFNYDLQIPIFTQCYGGAGAGNDDIIEWVNSTSGGIFNYRGHGSDTEFWQWGAQGSFSGTHVAQLTNEDRLFVLFDVCCDNMNIVSYTGNCLCEQFMKSPVASVAINGAIIPSYTIPNHDYDKEMYKAVFHEGIYNIGYVTNFANLTVLNNHGTIGRSNVRTYLWLGDASLEPWTLQPTEMAVEHDEQIFLGTNEYNVVVNGSSGPVENAMVCVSNADQSLYSVAYTDASGFASVTFENPVETPGEAYVTVSGHNYLPYQAVVAVIPMEGAYVVKDQVIINDEAGNGNGMMDYGESITLSLSVKNVGLENATDVTVNISSDDDFVTITTSSAFYGEIPAEGSVMMENAFAFDVAENIPDNHYVLFSVDATDGTNNWHSSFSLQGHAPVLEMGSFTISDPLGNNNGKLDPGETVEVTIDVNNTGSSGAYDVWGGLSSIDAFIIIESDPMSYGDIQAEGSASQPFIVTADINTPTGHMAKFNFNINAWAGITGLDSLSIVVGQIPVCIIDLDGNHNSGDKMQEAMQAMDVAADYVTAMPDDLSVYSSVFVCLGIYSSNHTLTGTEGQNLADFVELGGMIYMEGGDTWAYDSQTAVHELFNINGIADGSGDLGTIEGMSDTFTEGLVYNYTGDNSYIDHLAPSGDAFSIFKNASPSYINAIANDAGDYKTIGASFEFGGLVDGVSPSTREELMKLYLDFFSLMPPEIQANFTSDVTTICPAGNVQFTDISIGDITSWEWSFPGGYPETSTEQNPTITYDVPGNYDVNLIVSNGELNSGVLRPAYITVNEIPTAMISGTTEICIGDSAMITIDLTGNGPWSVLMASQDTIEIESTPYSFWTHPEESTEYSIETVSDVIGCSNVGQGVVNIGVNALPTATISGTTEICHGDSAMITVDLTGNAPWSVVISNQDTINMDYTPYFFWVYPQETTEYSIESVSDVLGCFDVGQGTANIMVLELPTGYISGEYEICPGDSAMATVELTGTAPWNIDILDGETNYAFENIESSTFIHWFHPVYDMMYTLVSVSDANLCSNVGEGVMTATLKPLPAIPAKPEGVDSVDVYKIFNTDFTVSETMNATSYIWTIMPENSGVIAGSETTGSVIWNEEFEGEAMITVKGVNDCGTGEDSEVKIVTVFNSVGFREFNNIHGVKVIPNPNNGSFRVEIETVESDVVSITLMNAVGAIVFKKENITINQSWTEQFNLNNLNEGVYYLSINGEKGKTVEKVIIKN